MEINATAAALAYDAALDAAPGPVTTADKLFAMQKALEAYEASRAVPAERDIRQLALAAGFKLKPQPDGSDDLNPYVFEFARALLAWSRP